MEVEQVSLRQYTVRDGIVQVYCHVERGNNGIRMLFIDRIDIHGTIEITELLTRLRKIKKWFKENKKINW